MAGYTRQSVADIISGEVVKAAPLNAEFNALRDAFASGTGHTHDGTTGNGAYITTIAGEEGFNKVFVDETNNRISFFIEIAGAAVEQLRIQDGAIVPVTDDDIDLGASGAEFKDLYIDGTANLDAVITAAITATGGTINNTAIGASTPSTGAFTTVTTTGQATLASADINGGTVDGAVVGGTTPAAGTFTNLTANTGITGTLTGNVTGNLTGNVVGNVTGDLTGNVTGNVTAATGASTFNNLTVNGTLDVTGTTIANVTDPVLAQDAATKNYVDTNDALKLNLTGGTMSGDINMGTLNKVTNLAAPTATADAATKGYVDTSVANVIDSAPAALDTLNELAAALGDDANFSTTVTNSIATKLPLAGGTMSGAIAMGTNKITGLGNPTLAQDAATKTYVDTADATKLNLSGGTMSGAIAMGTSKITGLGDPTANQDAATKTYVDTADATKLNLSGGTMTGSITMGANKVTSTATPTVADDLTRKGYVDSILGSATDAATSAANALTSETNAATSATNAATSETNAATSATNAATSATNAAASYDDFDDRYLGAKASAPTVDNDGDALIVGALYFDTTDNAMKVYSASGWVAAGSSVNGTANRYEYVVGTASGTYTGTSLNTFPATYDAGFVDVYLNGVKLVPTTDFTATSGSTIVLTSNAVANDLISIIGYGTFTLANFSVGDATDVNISGGLSDNDVLFYDSTSGDFLPQALAFSDVTATPTTLSGYGITDAATSAQGALADSALQSADIGVTVQAYDVDTLKADTADTLTAPFRGTVTADNDLSFDMNVTNHFKCTPTVTGALTFTNITAGQSGNIWLDNSAGVVISAAASTYIASADLTTINTAGVYFLSYYSDGTNVMVSATPAVTSAGA